MCTQSRPLNVESSYESVTILHASSSVRCAANTPGSGLIGTLHVHDALSRTGVTTSWRPPGIIPAVFIPIVHLTTVSAAAGCAEPSSRLVHNMATDAAFPAWSSTARAALGTLRWQSPAQANLHACRGTETDYCTNAGDITICWASWHDRATLQTSHFAQQLPESCPR